MAKIAWKPGTMMSPLPAALISCGTIDKPNMMTASWTGIISSDPVTTYVSIQPTRYSHEIISETKEFVINLTNLAMVEATDFCGVRSGRDLDKFEETGLTASKSENISAPQVLEAPVSMECKVLEIKNYGSHDMFIAEVVSVSIDDKYLDDKGRLELEKAGIIAFMHGQYFTLGRLLGKFGFSVNKDYLKEKELKEKNEFLNNQPQASVERTGEGRPAFKRDGDRPQRTGEGRPAFKRDGDRPQRTGEGRPAFKRDGDRPQRTGEGRPAFKRDGDRPQRTGEGRPAFKRDGDRPQRTGEGRPAFKRDGDRPQRTGEGRPAFKRDGDRPQRTGEGRPAFKRDGDRPQRTGEGRPAFKRDGDKPQRTGEGRPAFKKDGDRPQRTGEGKTTTPKAKKYGKLTQAKRTYKKD